jgi:hypothetical protein
MKRCFSLAELMVAIGILAIGIIIIGAAFPVALDMNRQAAELSAGQLVLNEATNTIKTKVQWTDIERYVATPGSQRIGASDIYLPEFSTGFQNMNRNDAGPIKSDLVYRPDGTGGYGWMCAVQKMPSSMCYKFWVFVLREPIGVLDGNGDFRFYYYQYHHPVTPPATPGQPITLTLDAHEQSPDVGEKFFAQDGYIYTIQGITQQGMVCNLKFDREVTVPLAAVMIIGGQTRKNPIVTVFQTVITY